jgi:hypothetical protein
MVGGGAEMGTGAGVDAAEDILMRFSFFFPVENGFLTAVRDYGDG